MKNWIIQVASLAAVGLAFMAANHVHAGPLQFLAVIGAMSVVNILYVSRRPRSEALRQILKLKVGQRIEVEGRPGRRLAARLWERQEGR